MMEYPPARSTEQRKRDVLARLEEDVDAWVSTAGEDGIPHLIPLSFVWHDGALLMCTRGTNPTARNLSPTGTCWIALDRTRDVVLIESTAEVVASADLPTAAGDAFTAKLNWDPRPNANYVFLRFRPRRVLAWREENELRERELMQGGVWRV
ncbi:pyridoxamine 5'-phosphate oxidase family protein [Streptomyces sp. NPDC002537]